MASSDGGGTAERPATGAVPAGGANAEVEALEQEREFLLRSLADLDAELAAGDIEEDDYHALTDGYTARTAVVLKELAALRPAPGRKSRPANGRSPSVVARNGTGAVSTRVVPTRVRQSGTKAADDDAPAAVGDAAEERDRALASRRRWRATAVAAAIVAFGGITVWAVTSSTSHRQNGQTITGNAQLPGSPTTVNGIDPRLGQAVDDANKGDYLGALKLYRAILKDDPQQPVALANQGWLEAQIGLEGDKPSLVTSGLASIVQAEKADTSYAEPHFYRGDVLLHQNDAPGAVTEFQTFLALADPSDSNYDEAKALLQQAIKSAGPNVPAGVFAPTTTSVP